MVLFTSTIFAIGVNMTANKNMQLITVIIFFISTYLLSQSRHCLGLYYPSYQHLKK